MRRYTVYNSAVQEGSLRRFLFSRWFFGLLVIVLLLDMIADILEQTHPLHFKILNYVSIAFDAIGVVLALWMFIDLSRRRPTHGGNPDR